MSVEAFVIQYLAAALPEVPVSGNVPSPLPDRFVTVEKTGSRERDFVYTSALAVQSWAKSTAEAAELNERVKALMARAVELPEISSCELDSDYNYTDTARNHPRYQAVFAVVYFEED